MKSVSAGRSDVAAAAHGAARRNQSWVAVAAHAGYAARGVVYLLIGGLALLAALGRGGQTGGSRDALRTTLDTPGGWILLALIALGLVGYSVWRLIQAVMDVDDHGTDAKGLAVRAGLLVSAVTHIILAVWAGKTAWGTSSSGGDSGGQSGTESWTGWLLSQPFGPWLVGLLGLTIIGVGIAHAVKAYKGKFEKYLNIDEKKLEKLRPVCKFGLYARGVSFVIIGGFFLYAAWTYDASQAGGLDDVFHQVRSQPFGQILLALLAAGLFSFGIYGIVQAIYRRVGQPSPA